MDAELQELYQEVILDHNKNPRNFHKIEKCTHHAEGFNPLCGDHLDLYLKMENDRIEDISFEGNGCAISKSSSSIMTEMLKGKSREEAERIFNLFHDLITDKKLSDEEIEELGKLAVLQGVKEFPMRVKCASLPWHTFHSAIKDEHKIASTE